MMMTTATTTATAIMITYINHVTTAATSPAPKLVADMHALSP